MEINRVKGCERQIPTIYGADGPNSSKKNWEQRWEERNQFCLREIEGRIDEGYMNRIAL